MDFQLCLGVAVDVELGGFVEGWVAEGDGGEGIFDAEWGLADADDLFALDLLGFVAFAEGESGVFSLVAGEAVGGDGLDKDFAAGG